MALAAARRFNVRNFPESKSQNVRVLFSDSAGRGRRVALHQNSCCIALAEDFLTRRMLLS
jgi:hypothetical protein